MTDTIRARIIDNSRTSAYIRMRNAERTHGPGDSRTHAISRAYNLRYYRDFPVAVAVLLILTDRACDSIHPVHRSVGTFYTTD